MHNESLIFSKYNMSDRLPSFEYSQEILHDTTPTQNPDYLQTDADQNQKLGVCKSGMQSGLLSNASCFAFISTGQDEHTSALVETHLYFFF